MNKLSKKSKIIAIILLTIIFIIFSIFVNRGSLDSFDLNFYNGITKYMTKTIIFIVKLITSIGGPLMVIGICAFLVFNPKTRWKFGILVSFGSLLSFLVNWGVKLLLGRERPEILPLVQEGSYSYPSGHAAVSMVMYGILATYIYQNVKNKILKYILMVLCVVFPIIIGLSRVYLGTHYMTDVIGGWILGLTFLIISFELYKLLKIERRGYEKIFNNYWHNISNWFRGLFRN